MWWRRLGLGMSEPESSVGVYGISVAAELTGLTVRSLRLFERHGLVLGKVRAKNRVVGLRVHDVAGTSVAMRCMIVTIEPSA